MDIRLSLAVVVAVGLAVGVAWSLPGRRPLSWFTAQRGSQAWSKALLMAIWTRVTMDSTRRKASVMGTTPLMLFATILTAVAGGGFLLILLGVPLIILVVLAVVALVLVPNYLIRRRFTRWQRRVVAGLPSFLHHLQILLDLGLPLVNAVKRARNRVDGPLGRELDKVIFRLERGESVGDAFGALARDTQRMETLVLAATLSTVAGRRLSGEALAPLMVMLVAVQDREQETTSQSVDQVASIIPIMATFGALVTGLYFMLAMAVSGLSGVSL
ncbi:type II secretion system F family protein [Sulfobacillus sp. hq2]|uniref:type II secretion system F family protein n=1 Tax=Sulfobacillus TaxID=28033 RepID=UPI001304F16A|nr:type II secretion system F family protein [Sulfobacillus sp. hq2]